MPLESAMEQIIIRKGKPEDAHHFSELVILSSPKVFSLLFGSKVKNVMKSIFPRRRHYYSYEKAFFIEVDGKTAGMAQLHRFRPRKREKLRLTWLLLKYLNWRLPRSILSFWRSERVISDFSTTDCYLSNVAVYPEYRSLGLGSRLLGALEKEIRTVGKNKMVLHADVKNQKAIKLYERLGYKIESRIPPLKIRKERFEYFIMKKNA